jgi:hypothetical protein
VHIGADGCVAKRVGGEAIGAADPVAQRGEVRGVGAREADPRRGQGGDGRGDRLGEFPADEGHVSGVCVRPEAAHRRRSGVGVGRGDEDSFAGNPGAFRGEGLSLVDEGPGQHTAVDDHDREAFAAVAEGEGAREEAGFDLVDGAADHPAVDEYREPLRCDVDEGGPSVEVGAEARGQGKQAQEQEAGAHNDGQG